MALAITDVAILDGEGALPLEHWHKVDIDLNEAAGGSWLYLSYRRDPAKQDPKQWITGLKVVGEGDDPLPAGWTKIDTDLNAGTRKQGDKLYLAYEIGGVEPPIVGLTVVNTRTPDLRGYHVIDRDLNSHAGGSDLFVAYLRRTKATLTIESVTCAWASSGTGNTAKAAGDDLLKALGAATEAGAAAAADTYKGPQAIALGAATAAVKTILEGEAVRMAGGDIATGIGRLSTDDFYLRVNGAQVWPFNRSGCVPMWGGHMVKIDLVLDFDRNLTVTLMERDKLGWFLDTVAVHDELGEHTFTPGVDASGAYLFFNRDEATSYFVDIKVDGDDTAAIGADSAVAAPNDGGGDPGVEPSA